MRGRWEPFTRPTAPSQPVVVDQEDDGRLRFKALTPRLKSRVHSRAVTPDADADTSQEQPDAGEVVKAAAEKLNKLQMEGAGWWGLAGLLGVMCVLLPSYNVSDLTNCCAMSCSC